MTQQMTQRAQISHIEQQMAQHFETQEELCRQAYEYNTIMLSARANKQKRIDAYFKKINYVVDANNDIDYYEQLCKKIEQVNSDLQTLLNEKQAIEHILFFENLVA